MSTRLPPTGRPHDEILSALDAKREGDADYKNGRTWSLVYWAGDAHHELLREAHDRLMATNALNPLAFKSLKRMEREVVEMTARMLNAPESAVGTMTSGGTESLLLAVKTYRDRARKKRPWILRPNIVAPETIHVAFDKAAHLFGVRLKLAPVGDDGAVDVDAMRRLVDAQTILLAASAPQYPHGTVDPIPAIAALARKKRLPLHVDACFGGFMLPWLERLGVAMPTWDFRVPGVTSISADIHKYGYGAKGASVIVYRDMDLLRHQFFVTTRWAGGIYVSPGLPGTRPGGPIAAAWAAMNALGESGYLALAKEAWQTAERLRAGIGAIAGLRVMGSPHATIVTWTSDDDAVDVFAVADLLQEKGWAVDRQQRPPSVHLTANASNAPIVDSYLADLAEAVAHVRARPELKHKGEAAVYGLMAKVPIDRLVAREVLGAVASMYAAGADPDAPPDTAAIDRHGPRLRALLDGLDEVRARLGRLSWRGRKRTR